MAAPTENIVGLCEVDDRREDEAGIPGGETKYCGPIGPGETPQMRRTPRAVEDAAPGSEVG